jgi:pilus assembly protein Flp/PilA
LLERRFGTKTDMLRDWRATAAWNGPNNRKSSLQDPESARRTHLEIATILQHTVCWRDEYAAPPTPYCENKVRRGGDPDERNGRETKMLTMIEQYLAMAGIALRDEEGQGLIEYVLIAALISIAAIGALTLLGPQLSGAFTKVDTALT